MTLNLDIDFYWSMYLDYLVLSEQTDICVVSGIRTTQQFAQCMSMMAAERIGRVQGVIHPLINVREDVGLAAESIEGFAAKKLMAGSSGHFSL